MIGKFPAVLNFNQLFLKLNRFICNIVPVVPDHRLWLPMLIYAMIFHGLLYERGHERCVHSPKVTVLVRFKIILLIL
jgi:hypothetical protein